MARDEAVPLLAAADDAELSRPLHPCRNMTLLLVVSLLVNAVFMSVIMTDHMVHSAEHMVADGVKTNQLRAINAQGKSSAVMHNVVAAPSMPPSTSDAQHRGADKSKGEGDSWDSREDDLWHSMDGAVPLQPGGSPPSPQAARAEKQSALPKPSAPKVARTPPSIVDSPAAVAHKRRSAKHAVHVMSKAPHYTQLPGGKFDIQQFRLALLMRRKEREAGHKPTTLLHPLQLRDARQENPNDAPAGLVDRYGAFYDPKLKVLVDANLLGTRAALKANEAKMLLAEEEAADAVLPQLAHLTTEDDEGHLIEVPENEAQQLAGGIFTWGHENPDTGDIRLDCTDTLADAGSNGGLANRFWGSDLKKVDACGPHSACADKCAYEPCNVGDNYRVECPSNCGHYGADVFGGAGRTPNIFMDDSSICRAALAVGVGSMTAPFFVDLEIVPAEPAYEGHLQMGNGLTTFNYVWHEWDWAENPEYSVKYTSSEYACCSNPGAGATPHLGDLTPTAKFRMAYDGTKWVNRVAFTIKGGEVPVQEEKTPDVQPTPKPKPMRCSLRPQCPQDGPVCCRNVEPGPNPEPVPDPIPPRCGERNLALQFNGAEGDGAELEDDTILESNFIIRGYKAVTVEMWVKDNTLPAHRTVYFGGGEFQDEGVEEEMSCVKSGFSLGQWKGQLTFDVATSGGAGGAGCGVHVRAPDWALGPHRGKWVHVAGVYNSQTSETSLFIDGKLVHTDYEGAGTIVWPSDESGAKFVLGRNGDFLRTIGGSGGMDGAIDEVRVWTAARSLDQIIGYMHKTMPDNGAYGPFPMATVALYFRFECQDTIATALKRICTNAEWPEALQLGGPTTKLVDSGAPIELLVDPMPDNCPAPPETAGPTSFGTPYPK